MDKTFPIYKIEVKWSEDRPADMDLSWRRDLLPEGRFWNSTGWYQMEREYKYLEEIRYELLQTWWPEYAKKRHNPDDLTITVIFHGEEVWCSGWFSHWTFDVGLGNLEVLRSFERYVDRIRQSDLPEDTKGGLLMCAEDVWRWHDEQGGMAPCRCPGCKKLGIIRIDH